LWDFNQAPANARTGTKINMKFILQRLFHTKSLATGDYTCGFLQEDERQAFRSFVLEDTHHETKIPGSTRIPAGFYELKIRKEATPLTLKHREAYKALTWFKNNPNWYHIEITGIPNYAGVYIHSGNDDAHTLGCVLPNYAFDLTLQDSQGAKSSLAVNDFYALAYPVLEAGSKCFLEVRDEPNL